MLQTPWYSEFWINLFHNFNIICFQLRVDFLVLRFSYNFMHIEFILLLIVDQRAEFSMEIHSVLHLNSASIPFLHFYIHRSQLWLEMRAPSAAHFKRTTIQSLIYSIYSKQQTTSNWIIIKLVRYETSSSCFGIGCE